MTLILAIETSTKNCSIALFNKQSLIASKEHNSDDYLHSEQLTIFIQKVLIMAAVRINDIDAVALSKGPGSYTGLRIGTSVAKGLCYGLDVPLISVSTLKAMSLGMSRNVVSEIYCPMIDARRMEVFSALFDFKNNNLRSVQADIVSCDTYAKFLNKRVLFFGDGALKCKEVINNQNARFIAGIFPSAKHIGELAYIKFQKKEFEDVAYFEPYYLKDFVSGRKSS